MPEHRSTRWFEQLDVDELQRGDQVYVCYPKVGNTLAGPYEYLNTATEVSSGKALVTVRDVDIVYISLADDPDFGAPLFYKRDYLTEGIIDGGAETQD